MTAAISRPSKAPRLRANPEGRSLKPHVFGRPAAKPKIIRIDEADLRLIERACKLETPRPSSSYYIVRAAVNSAKAALGLERSA